MTREQLIPHPNDCSQMNLRFPRVLVSFPGFVTMYPRVSKAEPHAVVAIAIKGALHIGKIYISELA